MGAKSAAAKAEEEFGRAIWEWIRDGERPGDTVVTICLAPTERLGVFKVIAREHWTYEGRPLGLRRQAGVEWPTSSYGSLVGACLDAVTRLEREPTQERLPWWPASA